MRINRFAVYQMNKHFKWAGGQEADLPNSTRGFSLVLIRPFAGINVDYLDTELSDKLGYAIYSGGPGNDTRCFDTWYHIDRLT